MSKYLRGELTKKIFYLEESNFLVGNVLIKETDIDDLFDDYIVITGNLEIDEKKEYEFIGELKNHKKYGLQFEVLKYTEILPTNKEKIIEYLSSDFFPGIGEKIAEKLYKKYHEKVFDVLKNEPLENITVKGVSSKKIASLKTIISENEKINEIIDELLEFGFSMKEATKIYKFYGDNYSLVLKNNPYQILDDIKGIYFKKIDDLAVKNEINNDVRITNCIIYLIKDYLFKTSNTIIKKTVLKQLIEKYLNMDIEIEEYLDSLVLDTKIVDLDEFVTTTEYFEAENDIADFLLHLSSLEKYQKKEIEEALMENEKEANIEYNTDQRNAILSSLRQHLTIITGGPGVGKTTIVKAIVDLFKDKEKRITLLAPTGRASKKLNEYTNEEAMTIHRFLKWNKETDEFSLNEFNKSDAEVVIVDEMSMVDSLLFQALIKSLESNVMLILIGDYFQLSSVAPGNVFKDIILSKKFDVHYLEQIYRQKEDSYIPIIAKNIKEGIIEESIFENHDDYKVYVTNSSNIVNYIEAIYKKLIEFEKDNIQIVAPIYRGQVGIDNINLRIQNLINKEERHKKETKYMGSTYRELDKVIQLVNLPDEGVYNGDIGYIERITEKEVIINFLGVIVKYDKRDLKDIKLAYSISIHKSQGSEFDYLIVPISRSYNFMLYRTLLYTAITRAKKKVFIICEKESYIKSIENNISTKRETLLEKLILEKN